MSDARFTGRVPVPLGACTCPSVPHPEGDEVYLLPRLSFDGGVAAEAVLNAALTGDGPVDEDALAKELSRSYLTHQVVGWNLTNGDGGPLAYSTDLLMANWTLARKVADAADDLYSEDLLAPLVAAVSTSSQPGQTAGSTSPRTRSGSKHRKR